MQIQAQSQQLGRTLSNLVRPRPKIKIKRTRDVLSGKLPLSSSPVKKKKKNEGARKNRKNKAEDTMIIKQEVCARKNSRGSKMFIRIKN